MLNLASLSAAKTGIKKEMNGKTSSKLNDGLFNKGVRRFVLSSNILLTEVIAVKKW
jgi:hypothetical protein